MSKTVIVSRGFGDRPVVLASSIFLSTSASLRLATAAKGDCFALFLNLLKPKPLGNSPHVHHVVRTEPWLVRTNAPSWLICSISEK